MCLQKDSISVELFVFDFNLDRSGWELRTTDLDHNNAQ